MVTYEKISFVFVTEITKSGYGILSYKLLYLITEKETLGAKFFVLRVMPGICGSL